MPSSLTQASPFGARLRQWRSARGVSQLALALSVGSTSRHMSFLETGRSRPTRQMVQRLGEALQIPLRERNRLLHAAGLPAVYPEVGMDGADLAPYRAALEALLRAHMPYPALVLDGHWNVLLANPACHRLYGADVVGANIVRRFVSEPAARQAIVNWPEVAWAGRDRLRRQPPGPVRREPGRAGRPGRDGVGRDAAPGALARAHGVSVVPHRRAR